MQSLAWSAVVRAEFCPGGDPMNEKQTPSLDRRRLFAAGGTAGALAAAAAVLPLSKQAPAPEATAQPAPESGGGYQLTAHVQQYYDTARI